MSFQSSPFGVKQAAQVELSAGFHAQAEHAGLVAPIITSNHPLDELLPTINQAVTIDEVALYDGLESLRVTEPTRVHLYSDWQDVQSKSALLRVEATDGYYGNARDEGGSLFVPTGPYAATVKMGIQPNAEKNQKNANRAFWTGVVACQVLVKGNGAEEQIDREVESANSNHVSANLLLVSGFGIAAMMLNATMRDALDITSNDYPQLLGIASLTGILLAPGFVYLKSKTDRRTGMNEAQYLTKKHKKQARELAAEFPVIQIQEA